MIRITAMLAAFVLSVASPAAKARVGPEAVFAPPSDFLETFHRACDGKGGAAFGECFVAQMGKAGASAQAQDFARRTGDLGYLSEFRDTGVVDVALAVLPFRANENQVLYLVNGEPPMVDVDDLSRIEPEALARNPTYASIKKSFPNVTLFPGPRSLPAEVRAMARRGGGQRFMLVSLLKDCRACKVVGRVRLFYDFDAKGKFLGTEIEQVRPVYR